MTQRSGHTVATEVQARDLSRGEPRECAFVLTVTAGPDVGRAFRLDPAQPTRVLIGTSPACELRLTDREASRRHAAIDRVGVDLRVTDLGSTNGTFVDRVKVLQADLQGGEFLRVGATMFRVDERFGQATLIEGGVDLILQVRCPTPNGLARDSRAILIAYDPEHATFSVEPAA